MMKFAVFECGKCRKTYESHIETGIAMPCPICGQFNVVAAASQSITGRCEQCNRPLESTGHEWRRDQFIACHNGGKK